MLSCLAIEFTVTNLTPLSYKIGCLANPLKNSVFTAALFVAALNSRVRGAAAAAAALSWLSAIGAHSVLPALTNTFFTIHPPLLYVCAALSIKSISLGLRRGALLYLSLWAISIAMGGFWSMQELSWGGWWNWDVIECGVAYQWALGAYLVHKSYGCTAAAWMASASLGITALVYTALNKLGVGVSIHSFVTSAAVQGHYGSLLLAASALLVFLWQRSVTGPSVYLAALLLLYCGTRSFGMAKPAILLAVSWSPNTVVRRPVISTSHRAILIAALSVVLANYDNSSLFYSHTPKPLAAALARSGSFWSLDFTAPLRHKLIWDGLWLSKPRYAYHSALESWATRSPSLRSAFYSFLK